MAQTHTTEHTVTMGADPDAVYALLADAPSWPLVFEPTIYVERLDAEQDQERLRLWATSGGTVRHWTSRRELDPAGRRITFEREASAPPTAAMSGEWIVEPGGHGCVVRLLHAFQAVGDDPEAVAWISAATDRNSTAELAALKAVAEAGPERAETVFGFTDELVLAVDPGDVYDFLARAEHWAERIPHVGRVELREEPGGVQHMEMDTRSIDGGRHTTSSIRVCLPDSIVYKQVRPPRLMSAHTGSWQLVKVDEGVRVIARHDVVVNLAAARERSGPDVTAAELRDRLRASLGANSLATIRQAEAFLTVEGRRDRR